jgi:regulator of sigma E protease
MAGAYASANFREFVLFISFLSTSIGVLNLLPIPPLDGGVALMSVVERFGGRRLVRITAGAGVVGLILILGLVILANGSDIISLFQGQNRYLP